MLFRIFTYLILILPLAGCWQINAARISPATDRTQPAPTHNVVEIPLQGPISESNSELSGLAWYQDRLIFLPQYPDRFGENGQGALFVLDRAALIDYLGRESERPLTPTTLDIDTTELRSRLTGYEGFEAITFLRDRVFMIIETSGGVLGDYSAYLVQGTIDLGLETISLDFESLVQIPSQTDLRNSTDEAIIIYDDTLISIHEANGEGINPDPLANRYDLNLDHSGEIPFPHVDYRITDATAVDRQGYFWATNYFFPGDLHLISPDHHDPPSSPVERILKFSIQEHAIILADVSPIQLVLSEDSPRNWEGLVRFEEKGFLLVTDKYPRTIFGFVEYPGD